MKYFTYTLVLVVSICNQTAFSQSLTIRPRFMLGESLSYIVTEKEKASDLFTWSKGVHQFKATFEIQDTSNGYTINFTSKLLQAIKEKYTIESVLDKLRDGINLTYKMSDSGWVIDLVNYKYCQQKALAMFDSISFVSEISKTDRILLQALREKIEKPEGLQLLLEPVILFNEVYLAPAFRPQNDYHAGTTVDIFYQPQITGTIITNLNKFDRRSNTAILSVNFIANADSAAKKIIPTYNDLLYRIKGKIPKGLPEDAKLEIHSLYDISVEKAYPKNLYKEVITTYIIKSISEIRMELLND